MTEVVNYRKNRPKLTMTESWDFIKFDYCLIKEFSLNSNDESKIFKESSNYSIDDIKELVR